MYAVENEHQVKKTIPVGFSWTTLFFGAWVPALRQDWMWALIYVVVAALVINSDMRLVLFPFVQTIFAAFYNRLYAKQMWKSGFRCQTDESNQAFEEYAKSMRLT